LQCQCNRECVGDEGENGAFKLNENCDSVLRHGGFPMSAPRVPLNELAAAVQNAVSIEKLWVGFVAPDKIATAESAQQVANVLAKEAGVKGQPSVGQLGGAAVGAAQAQVTPHRIIGLIYEPKSVR
jgi:hypothetical protein